MNKEYKCKINDTDYIKTLSYDYSKQVYLEVSIDGIREIISLDEENLKLFIGDLKESLIKIIKSK